MPFLLLLLVSSIHSEWIVREQKDPCQSPRCSPEQRLMQKKGESVIKSTEHQWQRSKKLRRSDSYANITLDIIDQRDIQNI